MTKSDVHVPKTSTLEVAKSAAFSIRFLKPYINSACRLNSGIGASPISSKVIVSPAKSAPILNGAMTSFIKSSKRILSCTISPSSPRRDNWVRISRQRWAWESIRRASSPSGVSAGSSRLISLAVTCIVAKGVPNSCAAAAASPPSAANFCSWANTASVADNASDIRRDSEADCHA